MAGDVKLIDCLRTLIDPPIEVESSGCESLVGPDSRIIDPEQPSQSFHSSGFLCSGSPRLQWRGPCRVCTGFPNKPDRQTYIAEHGKESSQTFADSKTHEVEGWFEGSLASHSRLCLDHGALGRNLASF
jgi:hypothetical protein